ncbi:hypothetical protein CEXT_359401 [Caerostris extrusa]|uniref:Uncharacterized protein n=1 Tax=Caerostris extrusa TaxID=172846 RepID=A0AAV4WKS1_CAEEX|nr:hypothetical protein CEXT_359401 [Caerostris extrusa]
MVVDRGKKRRYRFRTRVAAVDGAGVVNGAGGDGIDSVIGDGVVAGIVGEGVGVWCWCCWCCTVGSLIICKSWWGTLIRQIMPSGWGKQIERTEEKKRQGGGVQWKAL